ncbi:unnamed protein product [Rhodiola kirilowii]
MGYYYDNQSLHFVLVPLMAPGHLIPMADIARVLAQRGVRVTIFTTPINACRIRSVINRAVDSGLPINITELEFPCVEAGLPLGCECLDMLPSKESVMNFMVAISMLQMPLEEKLRNLSPFPNCMISDRFVPFAYKVAAKLGIRRISFDGMNCFTAVCTHYIQSSNVHESVGKFEPFVVPGLPDRVELTRAQLPTALNPGTIDVSNILKEIKEGEDTAFGFLVNSFEELEENYVKEFGKLKNGKVWCIGPLSSCNKDNIDKAQRGSQASDYERCIEWLNQQEPKSVVYACLGSLSRLTALQLMELGLGLELSNRPFLWAVKKEGSEELQKMLSENGYEEKIKGKGLLIRGWAPQVLILSHPAIGAFVTHNGWNSTLEGISAGVPMIGCPLFAEQFFNEKLIVDILGAGVGVVGKCTVQFGEEHKFGLVMKREEIKEAVEKVLDEGEDGRMIREKAIELGKVANRVLEEGGSSYINVSLFIENIRRHVKTASLQLSN